MNSVLTFDPVGANLTGRASISTVRKVALVGEMWTLMTKEPPDVLADHANLRFLKPRWSRRDVLNNHVRRLRER